MRGEYFGKRGQYFGSFRTGRRRPGVLAWLVGINCAVYLIGGICSIVAKAGGGPAAASATAMLVLPGSVAEWLHRPWTILTYMFTHTDFLHLLFNMLWLLWFGRMIREASSPRRLLGLYIGGGLCGGALYLLLCSMAPAICGGWLLGASASVLAVMTATGFLMPDATLHLFFLGDVKMKWLVIFMILLALLGTAGGLNAGGAIAHLGGVAFGAVYPLALKLRAQKKRPRREPARPARRPTQEGARRTAEIMRRHLDDNRRLDELLDKIKLSGYESLSRSERQELNAISARLGRK